MNPEKEKMLATLNEIKAKIEEAKAAKPKQKIFADHCGVAVCEPEFNYEDAYCALCDSLQYIQYRFDSLYSMYDSLWTRLYEHTQNHLPAPKGAEQLQKAIDSLGWGGEYEVQKTVLYAKDGSKTGAELKLISK